MELKTRILGRTGLRVAVLGFGGAPVGFRPEQEASDAASYVRLIQTAIERGVNFLDTAPDYRDSETLIGRAVRGRREQVIIASKCGRVQTQAQTRRAGGEWEIHEDWSEQGALEMIEGSLRRLGTDYLDLAQLHSPPDWALDDGGALRGALRAKEQGKVRWVGLSADGPTALRAVEMNVFDTLQTSYSLLQQEPEDELLPAAARRGMGVIIKQPLANAVAALPGRPEHPDWAWKWDIAQQLDWPRLGANTPAERPAVTLRWALDNPHVGVLIAGMSRPEHLERNLAAVEQGPLDPARLAYSRAAYRRVISS